MRTRLALATCVAVSLSCAVQFAQAQIQQPNALRVTAFEYDSYYNQDVPAESPSDQPMTQPSADYPMHTYANGGGAAVAAPASCGCGAAAGCGCGDAVGSCCSGCASGCDSCCGGRLRDRLPDGNPCFGSLFACCNDGEPWKLFNPCCDNWSFGGWVNGGVLTNADGFPNNGAVPFISTNDLLMNQMWAYAERKADNGGCGWDFGGRIDYVFGADGPDTQAFGDGGWDFGWNSGGRNNPFHTYGSAIPQLYAEVAYNDLTVKVGRFYTIIGYEVVQAPNNFFYTHAYTMNYGEPFTHTGALGEYAYSDDTTIYGGYVTGWDSGWENLNDAHMFIGGIGMDWWEDATITYALVAGDNGFVGGDLGELYMHSIVVDYTITDAWNYVFQSDLGINSGVAGGGDSHWYGINQYLFYAINDCWSAGARFEWFRDEDGARISGVGGNYFDVSLGLNYKPNANVIIRPEIRADWFDANVEPAAVRPFSGGTKNEQLMAGVDFIFTF